MKLLIKIILWSILVGLVVGAQILLMGNHLMQNVVCMLSVPIGLFGRLGIDYITEDM